MVRSSLQAIAELSGPSTVSGDLTSRNDRCAAVLYAGKGIIAWGESMLATVLESVAPLTASPVLRRC